MQKTIDELRQQLAEATEARENEYRTRLALAVQCKNLREALKEALSELETISFARYKGIEAKCREAMEAATPNSTEH